MDDYGWLLIFVVFWLVFMVFAGIVDNNESDNKRDDSVSCVKAGGTWEHDACRNR